MLVGARSRSQREEAGREPREADRVTARIP